jgi:hypothetical protein
MSKIVTIRFGSHLYGTSTAESDEDYKGIFFPRTRDVLLGRIPKTGDSSPQDDKRKNLPGELDTQDYSLHHFVKLAVQGQTVAIDMLFAPEIHIQRGQMGWIWDALLRERSRFLSRNMNAFVGYARAQAAKYSLKGERLNKLQDFASVLSGRGEGLYLSHCWDELPKDDERRNVNGVRELQIAGKWYGSTTATGTVLASVTKQIDRYGKRAKAAGQAGGVDWKALSHAVRVSYELEELLRTGKITFPLIPARALLNIKKGEWELERVQDLLDAQLAKIEELAATSELPEKADAKWWDDWLVNIMSTELATELRGCAK